MKDVIIVGGGPTGCFLGERLANIGLQVTILEKDAVVGRPMCCAGIVGAEGLLRETGLDPSDWSMNELEEGVFHCSSEDSVNLTRNRTEAHVINRSEFDRDLAERAARAGAEIRLGTRCVGITRRDDKVCVRSEGREGEVKLQGRMIVGADGPNSLVAKKFGLIDKFSPIIAAQAEIVGGVESRKAHVFLSNDLSKNFFAWVVPADEVYRVGLGVKEGNALGELLDFVEGNPILPSDSLKRMVSLTCGLIPRGGARKIWDRRVILVGDAAGHVKPLTGGGLYMGLSCAEIAAEVASEALERGLSGGVLEEYSDRVNERFGREFELGNMALNIFQNMSDEDISEFLEVLEKPQVLDLILENATFDRHSDLIGALMEKGPDLLGTIGFRKALKYLKWII